VGSVHRLVAAVDAELGLQVARMDADGVHREEQLIGDLGSREVGRQVAQHPDLAEGELFIQAATASPSRLAAGRRRGPVPGEQALDLGDQGGVDRAVPGVALEQARRGVQQENCQRAVGFGEVERAFQGAPWRTGASAACGSPWASRSTSWRPARSSPSS